MPVEGMGSPDEVTTRLVKVVDESRIGSSTAGLRAGPARA